MRHLIRTALITVVVVGGFFAMWWSTFTDNESWTHTIVWVVWGLLAVAAVVNVIRQSRRARRQEGQRDPAPFDPVQAVYQGRTAPTFAEDSADTSSQITDAPPRDPLMLPDDPRRHDRP